MNNKIATITLSANELNAPSKSDMKAEWVTKEGPYICCL